MELMRHIACMSGCSVSFDVDLRMRLAVKSLRSMVSCCFNEECNNMHIHPVSLQSQ